MNLNDIKYAAIKANGVLVKTPTILSDWLSELIQGRVYLKLENLQITSSFKVRGALMKFLSLTAEQKKKGVVAMSAGNHAQGVAYHAQQMGIPATIIMPENTPFAKIDRTKSFGARVILFGENLSESEVKARELVEKEGLTLIHPYDDPLIVTGQGTVALEMFEQVGELDALVIPVGGGGLAGGMSIVAKEINPNIEIYGVQSTFCPAMIQALYPKRSFDPHEPNRLPLAEGIAVKSPGKLTQEILAKNLTDMFAVTDDDIEGAIGDLATKSKVVVEGAGAAGVAALVKNKSRFEGKRVGTVLCGGNIDTRVLSSVLMRSLVNQGRFIKLKVQVNDMPGQLARLTKIIGDAGGNIFELTHQRHFIHFTAKMVEIDVVIETHGMDHSRQIIARLAEGGYPSWMVD